jgi:serine/threonine protein kinase
MSVTPHCPPDGYASPIERGELRIISELDTGHYSTVYRAAVVVAPSAAHQPTSLRPSHATGTACAAELAAGEPRSTADRVGPKHPDAAIKMIKGAGKAAEEAWVLQALSHTHIVPILDYFYHSGHDCLVMPLAQYGTLADHAFDGLAFPAAADALRQLALALDYIHSKGYIHGDVKMENVLVAKSSSDAYARCDVQLADFGSIARLVSGLTMSDRSPLGTACYSPPEAFEPVRIGSAWGYGAPTDMWSLGCLLWEVVTGDCLPLGSGPEVIGRFAKEASAAAWAAVHASLLQSFRSKLMVTLEQPGDEMEGDCRQAHRDAAATLPTFLVSCFSITAADRPTAHAAVRTMSEWEPHIMFSVLAESDPPPL